MKSTKSKTTASSSFQVHQESSAPFFQQKGQDSFGSVDSIMTKPVANAESHSFFGGSDYFFSPTAVQAQHKSTPLSTASSSTSKADTAPMSDNPAATAIDSIDSWSSPAPNSLQMQEQTNGLGLENLKQSVNRKPIFESDAETDSSPAVQTKCDTCEEEQAIQTKEETPVETAFTETNIDPDATATPVDTTSNLTDTVLQSSPDTSAVAPALQQQEEETQETPDLQENINRKPIFESNGEAEDSTVQTKCEACEQDEKFSEEAVQTKLTIGEPNDKYEQEADQVAASVVDQIATAEQQSSESVSSSEHSTASVNPAIQTQQEVEEEETQEKNPEVKLQKQTVAGDEAPSDEENKPKGTPAPFIQRRTSEMDQTGYAIMFKRVPSVQLSSGIGEAEPYRNKIVQIAESLMGEIEAFKDNGSGKRVGYEHLQEIFDLAAPDVWDDAVVTQVKYKGEFPHWCGIFSVYAIKKAGIDVGNWKQGRGVMDSNRLQETSSPKPGDIGYFHEKSHHCIIKEVNGDTITSIDGNMGVYSEVVEKVRRRGEFAAFFTAFTGSEKLIQKKEDGQAATGTANLEANLDKSRGKGSPMDPATQANMESAFQADFNQVRIHTGSDAENMNKGLHAQAFAHGSDIYFNAGKYQPDSRSGQELLAHELTHTIQQGSSIRKKAAPLGEDPSGLTLGPLPGVNPNLIQRGFWGSVSSGASAVWDSTGGAAIGAAADLILDQMRSLAPDLVDLLQEIRRKGVFNYFKSKMGDVVDGIFDGIEDNSDVIAQIIPNFEQIFTRVRVIVAALANGDCEPLFAAVEELKDLVVKLAGKAWDEIVEFFQPTIDFFSELWEDFGKPALEWLKKKAGATWDWIKQLGKDIWDWFLPIREDISDAWDYIKDIIGLNADETGEEGLIQWAQRFAAEVWEEIKAELEPVIKPAKELIKEIKEILPLDAIFNLRDTIQEWLKDVVATSTAMGEDASNIGDEATQISLRDQILPAIRQTIEQFRGRIAEASDWVSNKIADIYNSVRGFFKSVRSNGLLRLAAKAIDWIETKAEELYNWVQGKVRGLFDWLSRGVQYIADFLEPIYDAIVKILEALGDLLKKLPDFLMGPLWWILPECIKQPIKDFFLKQILYRLPFFQKIMEAEGIWEKVKAAALVILKQIFVDGNLRKAIWTFFSTMMDILGLPPQLVTRVIAKGAQALSDILGDPFGFLGNFLKSLKLGFEQFFGNIGTHLLSGLQAWLLGKLEGTGIEIPKEFTFKSMFKLAFQILGITVDKLLTILEEVTGKKGLKQKVEKVIGYVSSAWDWFQRLMGKGEEDGDGGSFWQRLENAVGSIWDMILDGVIGWISTTIVAKALAWVAKKLDPTGVMAIITTVIDIFAILEAIMEKAKEILEMIEKVLDGISDIIKGIIATGAEVFERALAAGIPVALAIMSSLFDLDGVVDKVKEVIQNLQKKVENGIRKVMTAIKNFLLMLFGKGAATAEGDDEDDPKKELSDTEVGEKLTFSDGKEMHTLWIQVNGDKVEVMVKSTPMTVDDKLDQWEKKKSTLETKEDKDRADILLTKAKGQYQTTLTEGKEADKEMDEAKEDKKQTSIDEAIKADEEATDAEKKLKDTLVELFKLFGEIEEILPPTEVTYTMEGGKASTVIAKPLTMKEGNTKGSHNQSSVNILGWDLIPAEARQAQMWVRAHLLNGDYHGPAKTWNLVPGTKETNNNQKVEIENPLKKEIDNGKVMYTITDVDYFDGKQSHELGENLSLFPRAIHMEYGELEHVKGDYVVKRGTMKKATFKQDEPDFSRAKVPDINTSSVSTLWKASKEAGFKNPKLFFQLLVDARRKLENRFVDEQSLYFGLLAEVEEYRKNKPKSRLPKYFDTYFKNLQNMYQRGLIRFERKF